MLVSRISLTYPGAMQLRYHTSHDYHYVFIAYSRCSKFYRFCLLRF